MIFKHPTYLNTLTSLFMLLIGSVNLSSHAANHSAIDKVNNNIQASIAGIHMNYEETVAGTTFNKEKATIPGIDVTLSKTLNNLYLSANTSIYYGKFTYDGSYTVSGIAGTTTVPFTFDHNRPVYNLSGKLGYQLRLNSNLQFIPYGEIGYYQWNRHLAAPPVTGGISYDEVYRHIYVGVGAKLDIQIGPHFVLSPHISVGSTVSPQMDLNILTTDTVLALGQKPYYHIGLNTMYLISEQFSLTAFIAYKEFEYGRSAVTIINGINGAVYEPDSKTTSISFGVGASYNF